MKPPPNGSLFAPTNHPKMRVHVRLMPRSSPEVECNVFARLVIESTQALFERRNGRRPRASANVMNSNAAFQTTVVLLFLAHAGAMLGLWFGPRTITFMLLLNVVIAAGVLAYAASRARYSLGMYDARQTAFILFEVVVLAAAIWAFRHNRSASIASYVAFGLHFLVAFAAVVFAFTFKMSRLF